MKGKVFPWMSEVTKNAPQMAIIQLGVAFKNFFKGTHGYPTYRKKGSADRFSLTNDQFRVEGSRIRIPLLGWVRMRESLRYTGKIMSATISRQANRWFVALTVELPSVPVPKTENQGVVGIDLGLSNLATLSDGSCIVGPKALKTQLAKLRRQSKSLSRKQKGSSNFKKAKQVLAKLHAKIANIRLNALHQLTTGVVRQYAKIVIEDLNVKGMLKNKRLARYIGDMGFYEFRRQLAYKTAWQQTELIIADKWFASSKLCAQCGYKLDTLPLSLRQWQCPSCNTLHDRDINAAINLKNLAVSSTVTACGEVSAGLSNTA